MKNLEVRYLKEDEYIEWDKFVSESPQGNIFNKTFWLESVCERYKILVVLENSKIAAGIALPSVLGKLYRNPKLTPQLGVILRKEDSKIKYSTALSKEMEFVKIIIENLPKYKQLNYNFSYNYSNFLPFIWKNYNVSLRYTYILEELNDYDFIYKNYQYDCKYLIKKAKKNNIRISYDLTIEDFYTVNKKTFDRQNIQMPYTLEFLKNLDANMEKNSCRKIIFALNEQEECIAATYLLYDEDCTYYLMGGADPKYRGTGVQTLLIDESIKFASTVSNKFDFEGSMIEDIERSFREYGGKQKIIYNVYKSDPVTEFLYNIAKKNKNLIRKVMKI